MSRAPRPPPASRTPQSRQPVQRQRYIVFLESSSHILLLLLLCTPSPHSSPCEHLIAFIQPNPSPDFIHTIDFSLVFSRALLSLSLSVAPLLAVPLVLAPALARWMTAPSHGHCCARCGELAVGKVQPSLQEGRSPITSSHPLSPAYSTNGPCIVLLSPIHTRLLATTAREGKRHHQLGSSLATQSAGSRRQATATSLGPGCSRGASHRRQQPRYQPNQQRTKRTKLSRGQLLQPVRASRRRPGSSDWRQRARRQQRPAASAAPARSGAPQQRSP